MEYNIKQGEMLSTTTVRIVANTSSGSSSIGTGFLYAIEGDKDYRPCLITNKHVVEDATAIEIVISARSLDGQPLNKKVAYKIHGAQLGIIHHPDSNVDLCAITLSPVVEDLRKDGIDIHTFFFTNKVIPNKGQLEELDALEEVIMIGYPIGLYDEVNNLPLFRRGITATNPKVDFNGNKEFLVDMACIFGSSGSPVIHLNRRYRTEVGHGIMGHELLLLGVLYGGDMHEAPLELSGESLGHAIINVPINLGRVIKSDRIIELEELIVANMEGKISK